MDRYRNILNAVSGGSWAIRPEKLNAIMGVLQMRVLGEHPKVEAPEAKAPSSPTAQGTKIAVLPLLGVMNQRMDMLMESSGGTSTDRYAEEFAAAVNNPAVGAIVLEVDSPGGGVFGVPELADRIFGARGQKPVVAVANSEMASAAYWVASQADEVWVTPSGEVGSVGVWAVHLDTSVAEEQRGFKWSLVSAGKYKVEGNQFEPLGDDARDYMQDRVNTYYESFISAIARGRDTARSVVKASYGQGRMVKASDAVALGLADKVGTLDQAIARAGVLARRRGRPVGLAAKQLQLQKNRAWRPIPLDTGN